VSSSTRPLARPQCQRFVTNGPLLCENDFRVETRLRDHVADPPPGAIEFDLGSDLKLRPPEAAAWPRLDLAVLPVQFEEVFRRRHSGKWSPGRMRVSGGRIGRRFGPGTVVVLVFCPSHYPAKRVSAE
jgi:hypothetical protein